MSLRAVSRLRRLPLLAVLCGLAAGSLAACNRAPSGLAEKARFQLTSLEGKQVGPPDFPHQVVVVDFWATWCGPCHVQGEILEGLHAEYAGKGVQFLAVDAGEPEDTVRQFVAEKPFAYPVLLDPQDSLTDKLGIMGLPTLMIVDKRGRIVYFEAGIVAPKKLREILDQALA